MYYGYDDKVWNITDQYMFGSDFLVAPCMDNHADSTDVYFPKFSSPFSSSLSNFNVLSLSTSLACK